MNGNNSARFLESPEQYFNGSYERFVKFGGPCVYFHHACLREATAAFLSERHIELLYATLTAWGMHRMGPHGAKLTEWKRFSDSIQRSGSVLRDLRRYRMLKLSVDDYSEVVEAQIKPVYYALDLTESNATVVANAKALHHLVSDLIPPIDRQYTIRFFTQSQDRWLNASGKWSMITLPTALDAQFGLFGKTCVNFKQLAGGVDPTLFDRQRNEHGVSPLKALDNAIVNYVSQLKGKFGGRKHDHFEY